MIFRGGWQTSFGGGWQKTFGNRNFLTPVGCKTTTHQSEVLHSLMFMFFRCHHLYTISTNLHTHLNLYSQEHSVRDFYKHTKLEILTTL